MRMIGPNCMGLVNTDPAVRLNATFAPVYPPAGRVGALVAERRARARAPRLRRAARTSASRRFVSVGNKADVSGNDLIQYWEEDPRTDVILLYLESFGNPRDFSPHRAPRRAREADRRGQVRALARRARAPRRRTPARSPSRDAVVDALFRQAGVIRTDTLEELFDVATLLAHQPVPARAARRRS